MTHQALFPEKDKSKKIKCCLLQFLFGVLRANMIFFSHKRRAFLASGGKNEIGRVTLLNVNPYVFK